MMLGAGSRTSFYHWASAKPMLAAIKRCGSLVEFSLITVKRDLSGFDVLQSLTCAKLIYSLAEKSTETRTMLHAAIPALRRASSKNVKAAHDVYRRLWSRKFS